MPAVTEGKGKGATAPPVAAEPWTDDGGGSGAGGGGGGGGGGTGAGGIGATKSIGEVVPLDATAAATVGASVGADKFWVMRRTSSWYAFSRSP